MDSEHLTSADIAPELALSGPGGRLRAARKALRLDLTHIAAETRIPLRHLQAIEDDNYEGLPSRAYAIGFSRTFAQAVGLDPAEITDAVRAELADGPMHRALPSADIEPGDPARLPSSGLAWAMGLAALALAIGSFAFYNTYFGAGTQPGSLLGPDVAETAAPVAAKPAAPAASGAVVLTALEDGVWLRLSEAGGARLLERTLKLGEAVMVPATAADPRLNTGRPDALSVTIGGQQVAKISDVPQTVADAPVSARALLARASVPAAAASGAPLANAPVAASATTATTVQRPARSLGQRRSAPQPSSAAAADTTPSPGTESPAAPVSQPAAASEPAAAPGR